MASLFNQEAFREMVGNGLNEGLLKAAEPIVERALQEIEAEMRRKLAAMLIGMIEHSYNMERNGSDIVVRVALGKPGSQS